MTNTIITTFEDLLETRKNGILYINLRVSNKYLDAFFLEIAENEVYRVESYISATISFRLGKCDFGNNLYFKIRYLSYNKNKMSSLRASRSLNCQCWPYLCDNGQTTIGPSGEVSQTSRPNSYSKSLGYCMTCHMACYTVHSG